LKKFVEWSVVGINYEPAVNPVFFIRKKLLQAVNMV